MTTYAVTGTMNQAGSLTLSGSDDSGSGSGATASWGFSLNLPVCTYDAIGVDSAKTQMLLRRGLAVTTAGLAVTPAFDLTSEGSAFGVPTFTITGAAASATVFSDTQLTTPDGFFDLGSSAPTATTSRSYR